MFNPTCLYVVGPAADHAAIDRATAALEAAGFVVDTPTLPLADSNAEELAEIAAYDLDAALDADFVVALPGSDDLCEVITARVVGLPVVTLAAALAGRCSAPRLVAAFAGKARDLPAYLRALAATGAEVAA